MSRQSDIFTIAHEQRRGRGISMSLALRQAYAVMRTFGMQQYSRGKVMSQQVFDLGGWLNDMARKGPAVLAAYSIPSE